MLTSSSYRTLYRASAWYDILVTWPYMTPLTLGLMWSFLDQTHAGFGLAPLPELSVYGTLFANFFGTVVIIWSVLRIRLDDPRLGRYDGAGRMLFSSWMIVALLNGASPLLYGFLLIEVAFGILQLLPLRQQTQSA